MYTQSRTHSTRTLEVLPTVVLAAMLIVGCRGPSKYGTPRIVNVAEVHGQLKGPFAIHFNGDQWDQAIKGLKETDKPLDPDAMSLVAMPMPGNPNDRLAFVRCPPGCEPRVRSDRMDRFLRREGVKPDDNVGYTPLPDAVIIPDCICDVGEPEIEIPPVTPPLGVCRLVIRFHTAQGGLTLRGFWRLECLDINCGNCQLVIERLPGSINRIACDCT